MLTIPKPENKGEHAAYRWVQRLYELLYQPSRLSELTFYVFIGFVVFTAGMADIQSRQPVHALDCELNSVALEIEQPKSSAPEAISDYLHIDADEPASEGTLVRPQPQMQAAAERTAGRKLAAASVQRQPAALAEPQTAGAATAADTAMTSAAVDVPLRETTAPKQQDNATLLSAPGSLPMGALSEKTNPAPAAPAQPAVDPTVQQASDKSCEGGDFGANQSLAPMRSKTMHPTKMGNIGPYKIDLIAKIAKSWHKRFPEGTRNHVVVLLCIAKDGRLLSDRVVQGSGQQSIDEKILPAVEDVAFSPLPEWFTGASLSFNVDLSDLN